MAHDLVPKMSPYLDRHLVFPLLEFLQEKQVSRVQYCEKL